MIRGSKVGFKRIAIFMDTDPHDYRNYIIRACRHLGQLKVSFGEFLRVDQAVSR